MEPLASVSPPSSRETLVASFFFSLRPLTVTTLTSTFLVSRSFSLQFISCRILKGKPNWQYFNSACWAQNQHALCSLPCRERIHKIISRYIKGFQTVPKQENVQVQITWPISRDTFTNTQPNTLNHPFPPSNTETASKIIIKHSNCSLEKQNSLKLIVQSPVAAVLKVSVI